MKRVGRSDTAAELSLRRILFARGFRYRKNYPPVPGLRTRADLAFLSARVAVYVDGCFWHGCPEHATWPKNNSKFWRHKIEANRARDHRVDASLKAAGWNVVRVWEHEDPHFAADRIAIAVRATKCSTPSE